MENTILSFIADQGGYAKAKVLRARGIPSNQLAFLVKSGALVRLKRGLYALADYEERSELLDIQNAIPHGVFCLGTALSLHVIGTWEPPEIHLAIRRDSRIALPEGLPIKLFSFSGERFVMGVVDLAIKDSIISVYDREKTICDVVHFRNSLGFDIAMEALREYLKDRGRNIPQLLFYSKVLHMEGVMHSFLEALV